MREAIYDDLLPAQRHRLHLAAATAIEADETIINPPGARWGVLALHWKSAGDLVRALGASIQAAGWARRVGAPAEAADHLETALTLWEQTPPQSHPDGADRAALLEQAAEARFSAGQALRARTLGVAAVTELAGSADVERIALAHLQLGVYSRVTGEAACPAPNLDTIEALTTRLSDIEAMARSFGGQLLAEPAAFAAMARAEAQELSGTPQPEAWQAATRAWDHCGDQYWAAVCRFRTADALLRAKGDRSDAARITAEALAAARSLGAAPLAADLEVLNRRGRLAAGPIPDKPLRRLGLTEREAEVLDLLVEGRTNRQIGDVLFISEKTVSVHVTNLLRKLGVESRTEAAEMGRRLP